MTSSADLAADSRYERDFALGFGVGRDLGRERIEGDWVDRQPPRHFVGARWYHWMSGYRQGLRERANDCGKTPYRAGQWAFVDGLWRSENPYPTGSDAYEEWLCGWMHARRFKSSLKVLTSAAP